MPLMLLHGVRSTWTPDGACKTRARRMRRAGFMCHCSWLAVSDNGDLPE